MCITLSTL
jgi:hypothetical protein